MKMENLTKRSLALFLTIVMCLTLLPAAVLAEEETVPTVGTETAGIPLTTDITTIEEGAIYTISNITELKAFKTLVEKGLTFEGATVKLTADIDMSDGTKWSAIGVGSGSSSSRKPFSGTFDGCGYALLDITYLYQSTNTYGIGFLLS